ncbi:MAG: SusC/RagA family TonB-linked outer membrane protein [Flavisolibacter sp.]|nr:SusC/RagA family TonB-linked outer membrane protein [Flavisolibacter sp.]MBD0364850.1 SusC/RagA family TonB-linked outer membrane protein [Flavisolibacter sp.]MBD0374126.1 SusC/RagA family TonB-linked outer membrane protein [Flavisolibacter sp.]
MRKIASLLTMLMLLCVLAFSQTRTVTGTVRDNNGNPIPFATVTVKGTNTAVAADQNGNFSIQVAPNQRLVITAANFQGTEIAATGTTVDATLSAQQSLNEVVVTALGVRRSKNTLPYAAQQISGEDVSRVRVGNAAMALSGKISGLQIIQGNAIGGSTNVVIRGIKSLTSNNQALFVVDGVPIDNSNTNTANQRTGRGGYDYGNTAADINPDDIESINVLKGAAASALYGSQAANGVIMITTKKGRKGLGVTVNSGVIVGKIDKSTFTKYQKEYGAGYSDEYQKDGFLYFDVDGDGVKDYVVPTSEDASFGAKFNPNLMVYHWDAFDPASPYYHKPRPWVAAQNDPSTFYETSVSNNNSIFLDGGTDRGTFKLGYTRNDEHGVLPNSRVLKNIVNFGSTFNITDKLTATASANFSKTDGRGRYGSGYSGRNVNQNFRQWYQANVDIQEQKEAYFRNRQNITWNWKDPSTPEGLVPIYTDNYYWTVYENYETDTRSRIFGNISLDYKPLDWLSFLARISMDNYAELQEERIAVGSQGVPSYSRFDRNFNENTYTLIGNVSKKLTADISLNGLLGTNMRRSMVRSVSQATSGGLIVPKLYSIANSKGTVPNPVETYQPRAVDGYFAGLTLGYRDFITLDGTIRRDRSSTLPEDKNAYNYYAISGSWLFSHHLASVPWLSSGKIRLNYATVGNDAPWGSIRDNYDQPTPFGSTTLFSLPSTKNNSELKPEETRSKEIGLEMSFLQTRLGFDVTYYHTNTVNQIIPVATSTATGYSSKFVNSGNIENKGVELSLYASPVKTSNFLWNINVNWTRNRNKVLELYGESQNILLGSFQGGVSINATLGQPYGTIQGRTWTMIDPKDPTKTVPWDGKGQKVVRPNGYYLTTTTTTNVIGNANPDWIGGIYNTFRYKNLSLGFLVDVRQGGEVWSLDMYYGAFTGVDAGHQAYSGLNDLGKPIRNSLADGGGVILPGVTADGKPNTKRVVIDANWPNFPAAAYAYDASYVKLREVVLSYGLPQTLFSSVRAIKGVELSVVGRNLWIIHKNLPYSDPEENLSSGNIQGMQSGAYPTTRTLGVNLKLKF